MNASGSQSVPNPSLVTFAKGVIARLTIWPALRLAIEQSWGGPESLQKRTWMASIVVDAFDPSESRNPPDDIYIEEMLLQIMADEFDANLEDGSAESVAKDIVKLWADITGLGDDTIVKEWETKVEAMKGEKVRYQAEEAIESASEGDSGDEDVMDEDAPALLRQEEERHHPEPVVDEDGFTLVQSKRKGHK